MPAPRIRTLLASTPLAAGLEPHHLDRLAARTLVKTASPRGQLIRRSDPSRAVVVVVGGMVEVSISSDEGKPSTLGFLGPGTIAGDAALLDDASYAVTVIAASDVVYLSIDGAAFLQVMRESAALSFNVARGLAIRLRMMFRRNEWLTTLSVPLRLARFLVWLDTQQATPGSPLPVTQEQLGQLIGVSRETVNKHLRRWASEGWVKQRGRRILLLDSEKLVEDISQSTSELLHSAGAARP